MICTHYIHIFLCNGCRSYLCWPRILRPMAIFRTNQVAGGPTMGQHLWNHVRIWQILGQSWQHQTNI